MFQSLTTNDKVGSAVLERFHSFSSRRFSRRDDTETLNILNSSISAARRYYGFLQIIRMRIQENADRYAVRMRTHLAAMQNTDPGTHLVTAEEWAEIQTDSALASQLHLDIESFYVF